MTIENFIAKWEGLQKPQIYFYNGVVFGNSTIWFIIPYIKRWRSDKQKQQFYSDCKEANIKHWPGIKLKWYHKTW